VELIAHFKLKISQFVYITVNACKTEQLGVIKLLSIVEASCSFSIL